MILAKRPTNTKFHQSLGRQLKVYSNLFQLNLKDFQQEELCNSYDDQNETQDSSSLQEQKIRCYQYLLSFIPEIPDDNRARKSEVMNKARKLISQKFGYTFNSGNSVYFFSRIKESILNKPITIDSIYDSDQMYSMSLAFVKQISFNQEIKQFNGSLKGNQFTQIMDSLVKNLLQELKLIEIGKNKRYYENNPQTINLQSKDEQSISMQIYKGIEANVHPTMNSLFLMIDFCSRLIRSETVLQYIKMLKSKNKDAPSIQQLISSKLVGMSVITKYNNFQTYIIHSVDFEKNPQFISNNLDQMSLVKYYAHKYKIQIQDLNQPLLVSTIKRRDSRNQKKEIQIYLIPEICNLLGTPSINKKDNKDNLKAISFHTQLKAGDRYEYAKNYARKLNSKTEEINIKINTDNQQFPSIQLYPPKIYVGNEELQVLQGHFSLVKSGQIDSNKKFEGFVDWIVVCNERDEGNSRYLVKEMIKASESYKIKITEPIKYVIIDNDLRNAELTLHNYFVQNDLPQFVLSYCHTLNQNADLFYESLKKYFYQKINGGVVHQHVTFTAIQNPKNILSIASNIILQISTKLGQQLWRVEIPQNISTKTMLIGIETSTKSIRIKNKQMQVVGIVASINMHFTKYYSQIQFREKSNFQFENLSTHIKNAVMQYLNATKSYPEEIIIYRQGASDQQIQSFHELELNAIKNGFQMINREYTPRFAYFLVLSKIGQKFYTKNQSGEIVNPESGTVVVLEQLRNRFEFFLCAQNCNRGVCTPTRYICIYNTTNLNEESIQQLTYFQCFNYYNWQGAVRFPAPLMYARKLARFVSLYLNGHDEDIANQFYYI